MMGEGFCRVMDDEFAVSSTKTIFHDNKNRNRHTQHRQSYSTRDVPVSILVERSTLCAQRGYHRTLSRTRCTHQLYDHISRGWPPFAVQDVYNTILCYSLSKRMCYCRLKRWNNVLALCTRCVQTCGAAFCACAARSCFPPSSSMLTTNTPNHHTVAFPAYIVGECHHDRSITPPVDAPMVPEQACLYKMCECDAFKTKRKKFAPLLTQASIPPTTFSNMTGLEKWQLFWIAVCLYIHFGWEMSLFWGFPYLEWDAHPDQGPDMGDLTGDPAVTECRTDDIHTDTCTPGWAPYNAFAMAFDAYGEHDKRYRIVPTTHYGSNVDKVVLAVEIPAGVLDGILCCMWAWAIMYVTRLPPPCCLLLVGYLLSFCGIIFQLLPLLDTVSTSGTATQSR